jgi:hypothetical protein
MRAKSNLTPIETALTRWLVIGAADAVAINRALKEINPLLAEGVVVMAELVSEKLESTLSERMDN